MLDLGTGKSSITEGPEKIYANSNFQFNVHPVRAPNGRIFFPELDNYVAYYDPVDETVKQVGKIIEPSGTNKLVYQLVFGPDGKLYGGTQSDKLPTVFELDPATLQSKVIGEVGKNRSSYSYAYEMLVDPPWIYVAVGQTPWELAAINITTGESKVLATRNDNAIIKLSTRREGIVADLITGLHTSTVITDKVWCVDGKAIPFMPDYDPATLPFKPRRVTAVENPIQDAPEVDVSAINPDGDGIGRVSWRSRGATTPMKVVQYTAKYTSPVEIESLVALPDGSILGNAEQYHGFFRYDPATSAMKLYGAHGPSQGPRALMGGRVYIAGYPNGVLYEYDPSKPWTSTPRIEKNPDLNPAANPKRLGYFSDAGAHYAYFLAPSNNGRLYYAGRRERDGVGAGIGFYEPATGKFGGHHRYLNDFDPQGLVVLDGLKRIVFSGSLQPKAGSKPPDTQLIIFDENLIEIDRQLVKPGLSSTGQLFTTHDSNIIIGLIPSERALYQYDVAKTRLLAWIDLGGTIATATERATDRSIWVVLDHRLVRIDSTTLAMTPSPGLADLPSGASLLTWQGNDLYFAVHGELRRIRNAAPMTSP